MDTNGTSTSGLPERIGDKIALVIIALLIAVFVVGYVFPLI